MKRDINHMNLICQSHFGLPSARCKQLLDRGKGPLLQSPWANRSPALSCHYSSIPAPPGHTDINAGAAAAVAAAVTVTHCRLVGTGGPSSAKLCLSVTTQSRLSLLPESTDTHADSPGIGQIPRHPPDNHHPRPARRHSDRALSTPRGQNARRGVWRCCDYNPPNFTHFTTLQPPGWAPARHRMAQTAQDLFLTVILSGRLIRGLRQNRVRPIKRAIW